LISDSIVRKFVASVVIVGAIALAGCNAEQAALLTNAKANKPIPEKLIAEIQSKDMDAQSPMLVRLFKQEAELEVWKQDKSGRYALLKTYPICRWSGDLGPKVKEGDRQAPEGFYNITPAQMNPESGFYLSFNMGYPNAFDRSLGRTGSMLMVHGDCSSRGCYAMTDEQISEIYALGRESFFGGQRSFQVQAYPFRMTAQNMAKHRGSPHMAFWKMLKQGNDHFEVTQLEPKVDVCEQRYVFNADKEANASRAPNFSPAGKCPVYSVPDDIARAVAEKQRKDEVQTAELVSRGTASAPSRAGIDGGMHALFAAKTPNGSTGISDVKPSALLASTYVPPVPPSVNPPRPMATSSMSLLSAFSSASDGDTGSRAAEPVVASPVRVANAATPAAPSAASSGSVSGFFGNLARRVGISGDDDAKAPASTASSTPRQTPAPKAVAKAPPPKTSPAPKAETRTVAAPKPAAPAASAAQREATLTGSQPIVQSNRFDNRFSFR
jgi:murein L,D-transpeptidase YafK